MNRACIPASNYNIMGIEVLAATRRDAIHLMDAYFDSGPSRLVTFLNANVSNLAAENTTLTAILERSLVLNDGIGVNIAARALCGEKFPENLQGTDFVPQFLRETRHAFRIFAVGASGDVASRAMHVLSKAAPRHTFVGTHDGYFNRSEIPDLRTEIAASGADLVLVAMGSPDQELSADRFLIHGGGPSAICVGGLFDFLSKERPRAPPWIRSLRCEWIFRLVGEPQRLWRRYLIGNAIFMARLAFAFFFRSRPVLKDRSAR